MAVLCPAVEPSASGSSESSSYCYLVIFSPDAFTLFIFRGPWKNLNVYYHSVFLRCLEQIDISGPGLLSNGLDRVAQKFVIKFTEDSWGYSAVA